LILYLVIDMYNYSILYVDIVYLMDMDLDDMDNHYIHLCYIILLHLDEYHLMDNY
jgi:hypothetical protein